MIKRIAMGICYIIGAGEADKIELVKNEDDFVICADGGLDIAEKNGIVPDLVVGDFDSLGHIPKGKNVIVHPKEKDETDSLLAVNCGLEHGYKKFIMYGMLGGRLDHTYANFQLLAYLCEKEAQGVLIGCGNKITAVKNSRIDFDESQTGTVSVFSFTPQSKGVHIKGLKYEVNDYTMTSAFPIGVSNEFIGKKAFVSVSDGILIVMYDYR